jgi:hypothetical protein
MALLNSLNYRDTLKKYQDCEIDQSIGLISPLKSKFQDKDKESYSDGLTGADALFTSYQDFLTIHDDLIKRNFKSFGDLGAGNCRSKILFDLIKAPFSSFAFEFVPERISAARSCYQSLGLADNEGLIEANLKHCQLPLLDAYFIYLPVGETLKRIIQQLKIHSIKKTPFLYVIESHGDLINYLEDQLPTLKKIEELPLVGTRHHPNINVYQLTSCSEQLEREDELIKKSQEALISQRGFSLQELKTWEKYFLFYTYQESSSLQFIVKEENSSWLASIEGWQYGIKQGTVETKFPYRIHQLEQLVAITEPQEGWLQFVEERRDTFKPPLSSIKKLIFAPEAALERANGDLESILEEWTKVELMPL